MPLPRRRTVASTALLLAACAQATAAVASTDRTTFYAGTRMLLDPGGGVLAVLECAEALVQRGDSTITEDVVSTPADNGLPPERVATFHVSGSSFRITDPAGAFSGDGLLRGPAGAWTGWDATVRVAGGPSIEVSDSLRADSLVSRQRVFDPAHALQVTIVDRLARADSARFAAVRARLLGR